MCGIFGFFLNRPLNPRDIKVGELGISLLAHRGPDASGGWYDQQKGIFLGHTRLSIIDLSPNAEQPMRRDNAIIIYNGELYNFKDLRCRLREAGVRFISSGDTEVVLQSWLHWGEACLDEFDGMYVFALLLDGVLHLVTDPFGEKPLYWAETREGIYFASESAALVSALGIKPSLSREEVDNILVFGYLSAPCTGYKEVRRAHPAMLMSIADGRIVREKKYWTPPRCEARSGMVKRLSSAELDSINDCLVESIRNRLCADVPLSLFLSSGVDSALVASIVVKELKQFPSALTVSFINSDVQDEASMAGRIASTLGLEHHILQNDEDISRNDLWHICALAGEVNDNLTIASVYQMSKLASREVKVALSGIGGDEVFYGYHRYKYLYGFRHILNAPGMVRRAIASLLGMAYPARLAAVCDLFRADDICRYLALKNQSYHRWLLAHGNIERVLSRMNGYRRSFDVWEARHFDILDTLPYTFLHAVERGSMRASIEIRTPYLNRKLLRVISRMDQRAFLQYGHKSVVRDLLRRYLPNDCIGSKKMGFNYPIYDLVKRYQSPPTGVPFLTNQDVAEVWSHRDDPGWSRLLVRLKMLELFSVG